MKAVFALTAIGLGLATFATPSTGMAQACKQTLDMTPNGGPKMVQCHEVTDMPASTINGMCRPAGRRPVRFPSSWRNVRPLMSGYA